MDDLIEFLRARIAEDEELAQAAMWDDGPSATWTVSPPRERYEQYTVVDFCDDGVVVVTPENADDDGVGQHIARHDPARVLREVEAKRRIVEQWATHEALDRETFESEGEHARSLVSLRAACCELTTVYADHPDYRQEWRV